MNGTDDIDTLIRRYIDSSIKLTPEPEVAVALAKRGDEALQAIQRQFDSCVWPQRFWLYALLGIVAPEQKTSVLVARLPCEDDPRCLRMIQAFLKLCLTSEQARTHLPGDVSFKHPFARKIAEELRR